MTPAVTSILDIIEKRLKLIKTGNGYSCTLQKIERGRMTPWTPGDLPACNYWISTVSNVRNDYGDDYRTLSLFVEIHDKTRDDSFQDVASRLAADVVTALNRSSSAPKVSDDDSPDLDGAISRLILSGYDYEIGEGQAPWCGALVRFEAEYRTEHNDMENYGI